MITPDIEPRLHAYLGGIINERDGVPIAINGTADHVHLLIRYHTNGKLSDLLRDLKAGASGWVHDEFPHLRDFAWQDG